MMNVTRKQKKLNNIKSSRHILNRAGISVEVRNGGNHLIIHALRGIIDFWPSTGKFVWRSTQESGRGVFNLIKQCKEQQ